MLDEIAFNLVDQVHEWHACIVQIHLDHVRAPGLIALLALSVHVQSQIFLNLPCPMLRQNHVEFTVLADLLFLELLLV